MKKIASLVVTTILCCGAVGCELIPDSFQGPPTGGSDDPGSGQQSTGYTDKWAGLVNETVYELEIEGETARYGSHTYTLAGDIDYDFETQYFDPQVTAQVTFTHVPSGYTEFRAVYEAFLGKTLYGTMAMVPMAMEIFARHPETGEKCFQLLCKDETVVSGILRILKTKFPTRQEMENDAYCQRYLPAALLAGADYQNDYAPTEPYTVECGAAANKPQETKFAPYGTVYYASIFADGWESRARSLDVFLPEDTELYKIQSCSACYVQCRTIKKGPWKGLK